MATKTNELAGALPREMMQHTYPILYAVEESHWWYIGRRRIIASFVKELCDQVPDTARIAPTASPDGAA